MVERRPLLDEAGFTAAETAATRYISLKGYVSVFMQNQDSLIAVAITYRVKAFYFTAHYDYDNT